ncbi:MAG TPA: class I SAM-dependent methyltransferase [Candidatus Coprenecus avistercoris]|uniref:Class I SAM-dependent methyltransferase n=1 Tax=Candidatus Coprenecus avistercoris TaxID=2840730 RepID=A0A9D1E0D1_9BACT|nr:class I SAM-dependent methyltransferase [Candidatus Coprenecus avistercoris]
MNIERPSESWSDYQLIDSGGFEKLERFGRYTMIRPEPKALWDKALPASEWKRRAQTAFTPGAGFSKAGKEDSGVWTMLGRMQEQWNISYRLPAVNAGTVQGETAPDTSKTRLIGLPDTATAGILSEFGGAELHLRLGLTAFKHVGVFPEQAPNWDFIYRQVARLRANNAKMGETRPPRVLNLFAYTGAASLAARAAGADVTHLDSVRQVVTWARHNMEISSLDGIRWTIDDALKYVTRQVRRGASFDGIILDPPAYGRGPDGERWKLDECLNDILKGCAQILAPMNSFLVLNLYSNGYSAMLADTLVACAFGPAGRRTSGELVLRDDFDRILPLSVYTRLER